MTTVSVSPGLTEPTHDISLTDGTNTYGFLFASGPRILQEIPMSEPAKNFNIVQEAWIGGRGRVNHADDPTGFSDSQSLWTTSDRKVFQNLQWRFAKGLRVVNEDLPDGSETYAWWGLYGTANATTRIGRYLSRSFSATAQTADKGYLWIRRRGTPGTLTFELCSDGVGGSAGDPGAVLQTVTKTTSNITDTISVFQLFDWTGTESLTALTYHVKIYGASTDSVTNHWEVLGDTAGTGKMSTAGSTWTSSSFAPYYRIVDADIARKWWFFDLDGCMYAVSQRDDLTTASDLFMFGIRGTATSATGTTLVDTNLTTTADRWIGAAIRIIDGTGDGQLRIISDNDTNSFTVPGWDKTPSTDSQYIVYSTPYLTTITGTPGLGVVTGKPAAAARAAYFPQGAAVAPRYMVVAGTSHTFATDGTNYADIYYTYTDPTAGVKIAKALGNTANFKNAPATGGALSFANEITIGTTDYRITNMYEWDGVLYIFKEDGLFYFDGSKVYRVGNSFADAPDPSNGLAIGTFNKNLWFSWAHSVQRMIGADAEDMLNFKFGYEGLPADRRGTIAAIVSAVGWLFVAIDGGSSNYSSVLCYSGYGWHDVFRGWATGVRIRNLAWQPCPEMRSRLWIDVNGEMVYIEFPKDSANPLKDTTIAYQHEGVLTTATIDAGDPTFYKIFHELKVMTDELSTTNTIEVDYQKNENVGTSTWTSLGTIDDSPAESITMDYGSVYQIRFRFRFQTTASITPTIMTAWETNGWETEPLKYQYVASFRVSTEQDTKTGESDTSANTLVSWLQTVSSNLTKLTMRSLNSSMDNKVVFVSAPAISRDYVDEAEWGGRLSIVLREV